ncbi:MAG: acyl carrier protein [Minisyncoccota bacterium]
MQTRDTVIEIIAKTLSIPRESIHDDSKLTDIAKDSIALFELLISFEKTLGHRVTYEKIAHIETVGDIIAYADTLPNNPLAQGMLQQESA